MHQSRAPVLQHLVFGQQRVDGHFGRHPYVAHRAGAQLPFRYVQEPFGSAAVLKQVAHLQTKQNRFDNPFDQSDREKFARTRRRVIIGETHEQKDKLRFSIHEIY